MSDYYLKLWLDVMQDTALLTDKEFRFWIFLLVLAKKCAEHLPDEMAGCLILRDKFLTNGDIQKLQIGNRFRTDFVTNLLQKLNKLGWLSVQNSDEKKPFYYLNKFIDKQQTHDKMLASARVKKYRAKNKGGDVTVNVTDKSLHVTPECNGKCNGILDLRVKSKDINTNKEPPNPLKGDIVPSKKPKDNTPYDKITELYKEIIVKRGGLGIRVLTDKRRRKIKALYKGELSSLESWKKYFNLIANNKFYFGENSTGWITGIDTLIKNDDIVIRILEKSGVKKQNLYKEN